MKKFIIILTVMMLCLFQTGSASAKTKNVLNPKNDRNCLVNETLSKAKKKKYAAKLKKTMKKLKLEKKSKAQKIAVIYTYIVKHVSYDYNYRKAKGYDIYTAYGALVKRKAVCHGYARLYYDMCRKAGITSRVINSRDHAWNIVGLGGKYYNSDATWGVTTGHPEKYFLLSNKGMAAADDKDRSHVRAKQYSTKAFSKKYRMSGSSFTVDCSDEIEGCILGQKLTLKIPYSAAFQKHGIDATSWKAEKGVTVRTTGNASAELSFSADGEYTVTAVNKATGFSKKWEIGVYSYEAPDWDNDEILQEMLHEDDEDSVSVT